MTAVPHDLLGRTMGRRGGARVIRPGRVIGGSGVDRRARKSEVRSEAACRDVVVAGMPVGSVAAPRLPAWAVGGGLVDRARFVVAGRRLRLGRGAFAAAVIGALTAILVSLLALNTALTTDSFELQTLRINDSQLAVKEQELLGKLADMQSPVGLQEKARELGMVPAPNPVFIRLSDRRMLGESDPARMPPQPTKRKTPKQPQPARPPGAGSAPSGPGGESAADPVGPAGSVAGNGSMLANPGPAAQPGLPASDIVAPGGETGVGLVGNG